MMLVDIQLQARIKSQRLSARGSSRHSRNRKEISGSSSRGRRTGSIPSPEAPCLGLAMLLALEHTDVLAKVWLRRCSSNLTSITSTLHSIDQLRATNNADTLAVSLHPCQFHQLLASLSNRRQGLSRCLAQDPDSKDDLHRRRKRRMPRLSARKASALKPSTSTRSPIIITRSRNGTPSWPVRRRSSRTRLAPRLLHQLHPLKKGRPALSGILLLPAVKSLQHLRPLLGCNTVMPIRQQLMVTLPSVVILTQVCTSSTTATVITTVRAHPTIWEPLTCHPRTVACTVHQDSLQ